MRVEIPHFRSISLAFVLCILICGAPILGAQPAGAPGTIEEAPAQPREAVATHPALVFFAQHRLPEDAWTALFAAMRANLPEAAAEIPALDPQAELLRADARAHGIAAPQPVIVYLHGDCNLYPMLQSFSPGQRLGWVVKVGPRIEPVIHVECTAIGEELSRRSEWMSQDARTAAMSEALTRVILHEWAHIATQSAAHGPNGILKAEFGVDDLLPGAKLAQVSGRELR